MRWPATLKTAILAIIIIIIMSLSELQSIGQFTILPLVPGVFKKNSAELRGVGGMGGYGEVWGDG